MVSLRFDNLKPIGFPPRKLDDEIPFWYIYLYILIPPHSIRQIYKLLQNNT